MTHQLYEAHSLPTRIFLFATNDLFPIFPTPDYNLSPMCTLLNFHPRRFAFVPAWISSEDSIIFSTCKPAIVNMNNFWIAGYCSHNRWYYGSANVSTCSQSLYLRPVDRLPLHINIAGFIYNLRLYTHSLSLRKVTKIIKNEPK